ncbi:Scr1 family TA system antitoxin-like transcriptional regulator [Streptomyces violascens]|uniref:Scr1 family TA system antitoxin-like transcriptional regulator n=1 Tax=Streptomyces violascens TaxID=67381 RepID=UPI003680FA3A
MPPPLPARVPNRWPAPTFSFVLDEALLLRPAGRTTVQADRLRRLVRLGSLRNVETQVMPIGQRRPMSRTRPCLPEVEP